MANQGEFREVPIDSIKPSLAALRQVDQESQDFYEFVEGIRAKGILNTLVVRKVKDEETNSTVLALVDGLHRYTAAKLLGFETVPVHIITADEDEALEAQIVANVQNIATKPAEYSEALKRLLVRDPKLTMEDLAKRIGKSVSWLSQILKLTRLPESVKELVDKGKIVLTNAQGLALLPADEVQEFLEQSMIMPPNQFVPLVKLRAKELSDAKRQGRQPAPKEFAPSAHLRGLSDLRKELDSLQVGRSLINQYRAETAIDGWQLACKWALHLDPDSVEQQKQDEIKRKEKEARNREERKAEKQRKKEEDAGRLAEAAMPVSA